MYLIIVTSRNYRDALRFVDYLVISEDSLSPSVVNNIAEQLQVPKQELINMLKRS